MNFPLSPLTLKRMRTFRRSRRAWYSLVLLVALYLVSLAAELLCNDRPLYLRMNGRHTLPFLRFYPQDVFLNNGVMTRVDYKELIASPAFRSDPDGFVLMAPVPYGPREIVPIEPLDRYRTARITIRPRQTSARLDIAPDGTIVRALGGKTFFPEPVEGKNFFAHWDVPPELRRAIARRFENREDGGRTRSLRGLDDPAREAICFLPPFRPRPAPPRSVRVSLRTVKGKDERPVRLRLDRDGTPVSPSPIWDELSEETRRRLSAAAREALAGKDIPPWNIDRNATPARVEVQAPPVSFPHPPVPGHWMGIDSAGHDVLARLLYGLRISMSFGIALVLSAMLIGVVVGGVQGYFGGWCDILGQRFIEIWSSPPFLYVMILLGALFGRSFGLLLLCYGLFNWIGISYYMRAEFLRLRGRPFIEAARCQGLGHIRIMFRHILPNALTPIVTLFPFQLVGAVSALTALDYLGFGLPADTPSWGQLLHQAQQFRWAWWLILYPSLALFVVMLLAVFVGEGLRNAFDPKPAAKLE